MAFYGFNFRQSAAGGTGFTSDPAGTLGVPSLPSGVAFPTAFDFGGGKVFNAGYRNTASSTPAGTAPFASGQNANNPVDMRLAGIHSLTGNTVIWRVEVPNGTYDVRLGAGALGSSALQGVRLTFGTGPNDFVEVLSTASGTATAVPSGSEMDGSGAILTDAAWRDQHVGSATTGTIRITVKDGFIDVQRAVTANTNATLRHFSFQIVGGALQDVTLDTDDTGAKVDTTGTFTAGSAAVTIPASAGIVPGMLAIGLNVPFGTTVAALGAQTSGGVVTSLTLSSGSGVTAGTGAIRFARAAQFFEKEAPGKLVAPITTVNGATAGLAVLASDGVTPHPYLGIKLADPAATGAKKPYVYVKAPGFPNASPHAFKISQPDTSGDFTGSPHVTSLSLPVIASPTKPTTGFWSAVSTACFNLRKAWQDKFLAGAWPGYKGQAIAQSAVAYSFSDLMLKMTSFQGQAGGGKWFSILLDPAGDWSSYSTSTVYNFKPEQGGGLVIGPSVTSPIIYGNLTIPCPRGVEMRDLVWPGNGSSGAVPKDGNCLRLDPAAGQAVGTLGVFVARRLKIGALFDPGMTDANLAQGTYGTSGTDYANGVIGIFAVRGADQISVVDCDFFGVSDAVRLSATRIFVSDSNKFRRVYGDCHAVATTEVGTAVPFSVPMTGVAASDQEVFSYVRLTASGMCMDNPSRYPTDLGSFTPHPDVYQHRNALTAGAQEGPGNILMEEVQSHSNGQSYNDSGTARYSLSRQFLQGGNTQKSAPLRLVAVNCIGASLQLRGFDLYNMIEAYLEYNTMAGAARMPPSGSGTTFVCKPGILSDITVSNGRLPGVRRARKNIITQATFGIAAECFGEDNIFVNWDGTAPKPDTAMLGPFYADGEGRQVYDMAADTLLGPANGLRKSGWAALQPKAGVDAGAQKVTLRLAPGESDTMTAAQAATLVAVSESQAVGVVPGAVALRWNSGVGEAGGQVGADVTLSVQ